MIYKLRAKLYKAITWLNIFKCVTHGVLAFDRDIVQQAHKVEDKVGMDNIFKGFLVEVGIDPKQDSVAIASMK